MTEANRLTHYALLVTAFLWENTIVARRLKKQNELLVTALLRVNTIFRRPATAMVVLLVTAFMRVSN